MIIEYGQKIKVTIKRVIEDTKPFQKIEEITVEGTVSGVFQEDWCSVYDHKKQHAIIDLRNDN